MLKPYQGGDASQGGWEGRVREERRELGEFQGKVVNSIQYGQKGKKDEGEVSMNIAKMELFVTLFQRCSGAET